jgi:hypothetical protein
MRWSATCAASGHAQTLQKLSSGAFCLASSQFITR